MFVSEATTSQVRNNTYHPPLLIEYTINSKLYCDITHTNLGFKVGNLISISNIF